MAVITTLFLSHSEGTMLGVRITGLFTGVLLLSLSSNSSLASEAPDWQQLIPRSDSASDLKDLVTWLDAHGQSLASLPENAACPLVVAVRHDNHQALEMLLAAGAGIRPSQGRRDSALKTAVKSNDLQAVKLLLSHGASLEESQPEQPSVLEAAASHADPAIIALLITAGADPLRLRRMAPHEELSIQYCAIAFAMTRWRHAVERLQALLAGLPDDAQPFLQHPLLLHKGLLAEQDVRQLVIERVGLDYQAADGTTILHHLVHPEGDFGRRHNGREYHIADVVAAGVAVDARDDEGNTALHRAVASHDQMIAQSLLDHGADANLVDRQGRSPLHLALADSGTAVPVIVARLLEAQADPSLADPKGIAPVFLAARHFQGPLLLHLLHAAGAELNQANAQGQTPVDIAWQDHNFPVVDWFERHGVKADLSPVERMHEYIGAGAIERGKALLRAHKTSPEMAHILLTAAVRDPSVVPLALAAGANPNALTHQGESILSALLTRNRYAAVEALLKAGAQPGPRNSWDDLITIVDAIITFIRDEAAVSGSLDLHQVQAELQQLETLRTLIEQAARESIKE